MDVPLDGLVRKQLPKARKELTGQYLAFRRQSTGGQIHFLRWWRDLTGAHHDIGEAWLG